ncbi:Phosphate transport system permease protein PstC [Liberibacter crescens BT-1]|uniref:Phosphate transport system permease protein n=1 Tax=Liberibacter crescens (strain BT-1) TaxID=1215343 RepID=L0EWM0_LIBCB|nr:phosphate ABC transporter permease subunit PstC [Liberibacter crescens]AGA65255.1 Phosphate transport system permease protein PstC [Liberibacter crescens BT-1]AMC13193.1 ABC transporter permease [Liberibacter crescens]
MFFSIFGLFFIVIGLVAYLTGYTRSRVMSCKVKGLHPRWGYYGVYVALYSVIPALIIVSLWLLFSPRLIQFQVNRALSDEISKLPLIEQKINYNVAENIAKILPLLSSQDKQSLKDYSNVLNILKSYDLILATNPQSWVIKAAFYIQALTYKSRVAVTCLILALVLAGAFYANIQISPRLRVQYKIEKFIVFLFMASSFFSVLVAIGIIISMLSNAISFFCVVPAKAFFFGTVWDPRFSAAGSPNSPGQFGLIPLLLGTFYIGFIAMLFAVPIGLLAAIYMAEYASKKVRSAIKPVIEILAGIPTIVYGFFAISVVGPFLRDMSIFINGLMTGNYKDFIQAQSVLTAGLVMGIMLIPYVSSLSEDIISAVPRTLRDGSFGLGATRSETIKYVIFPAAFPGIAGALLMTASRTIGETMIVVLAAGVAAHFYFSPFQSMTTVTVKIMNQLTGDLEFTSPQTLVAFALGLTLFVITFFLNIFALYIVQKYQEKYE